MILFNGSTKNEKSIVMYVYFNCCLVDDVPNGIRTAFLLSVATITINIYCGNDHKRFSNFRYIFLINEVPVSLGSEWGRFSRRCKVVR